MSEPAEAEIDAALASSLESLDGAVNYRDWIVDLCAPHLGTRLVEVGAGHGTFTAAFTRHGEVCAVEPSRRSGEHLADRFATDPSVRVVRGTIDDVDQAGFDAAVMINVLEHIDDEAGVLTGIHRRLADDGRLVIWVPAFMLLYSRYDRRLGHHRRYRRRQLVELVESQGFDVVDSRYANLPGWFSWLLLVRLLRQEPTNVATVRLFDRWIVPVVRRIERRVRVPFGQSILVVARAR